MIKQSHTMVAKLMAAENIDIIEGNYKTAAFDIKSRIMYLPTLKDTLSKDVATLFTTHEIGHALFTPLEGWHDAVNEERNMSHYLNITEDARIERKVKDKFPGVIGSFQRGYVELYNNGFFDVTDDNIDELILIDKINMSAKIGHCIDVKFNVEEMVFYNRAMTTETFEEAYELAKDILEYTKAHIKDKEEPKQQSPADEPQPTNDFGDSKMESNEESPTDAKNETAENEEEAVNESTEGEIHDADEGEGGEKEGDNLTDSDDLESESELGSESEAEESSDDFDSSGDSDSSSSKSEYGQVESTTDEAFRNNEEQLIDYDASKGEQRHLTRFGDYAKYITTIEEAKQYDRPAILPMQLEQIAEFKQQSKKLVSSMIKEFELRKNAEENRKASHSKTGKLNPLKLHSYSTTEDIFLSNMKMGNAKSHGMVMMVDWSSSMGECLVATIKQTIIFARFCRGVGIPFEIYLYTSQYTKARYNAIADGEEFKIRDLQITEILNSDLKNAEFETEVNFLLNLVLNPWLIYNDSTADVYSMGGTPLIESLVVAHDIIDDFRAKHKVQKVNFVLLNDGCARFAYNAYLNSDRAARYYDVNLNIDLGGKVINIEDPTSTDVTMGVMQSLQSMGVTTLVYYITSRKSNTAQRIMDHMAVRKTFSAHQTSPSWAQRDEEKLKIAKYIKKSSGMYMTDEALGADQYMMISTNTLSTREEELDINSDQTVNVMTTAFKKQGTQRKLERVFAESFARAIA